MRNPLKAVQCFHWGHDWRTTAVRMDRRGTMTWKSQTCRRCGKQREVRL